MIWTHAFFFVLDWLHPQSSFLMWGYCWRTPNSLYPMNPPPLYWPIFGSPPLPEPLPTSLPCSCCRFHPSGLHTHHQQWVYNWYLKTPNTRQGRSWALLMSTYVLSRREEFLGGHTLLTVPSSPALEGIPAQAPHAVSPINNTFCWHFCHVSAFLLSLTRAFLQLLGHPQLTERTLGLHLHSPAPQVRASYWHIY